MIIKSQNLSQESNREGVDNSHENSRDFFEGKSLCQSDTNQAEKNGEKSRENLCGQPDRNTIEKNGKNFGENLSRDSNRNDAQKNGKKSPENLKSITNRNRAKKKRKKQEYLTPTRAAVLAEIGRRDFRTFVRLVKPYHEPRPWYQEKIIEAIQAWSDSPKHYTLILSVPPGHGKSYLAQLAIAWEQARNLEHSQAYVSFASHLADQQLGEVYKILESEEYIRYYGRLLNSKNVVNNAKAGKKKTVGHAQIIGSQSGYLKSVGRGGSLSGFRLSRIIVDDLLSGSAEAASPPIRNQAWEFYLRVLDSRNRVDLPLKKLVLATRWVDDDPTGRLLSQDPTAVEIKFPALKVGPPSIDDPREDGEALWPELLSEEALEGKRKLDPWGFPALYQQEPTPAGGRLFEVSNFRWFERAQLDTSHGKWLQSWDFRGGGATDAGSYAVGILAFCPYDCPGEVYIYDVVRERWSSADSLKYYLEYQSKDWWDKTQVRLVEQKADGVAIINQSRHLYGVTTVSPSASKYLRARSVQSFISQGQVLLPTGAPWVDTFLQELTTFPGAANDDQVDALSQLLNHLWGQPKSAQKARVAARTSDRNTQRGRLRQMM